MELIIGLIAVLGTLLILSEARAQHKAYLLRKAHIESLMRLDERTRISLPPLEGELVSAAIDEEIGDVK
jgi:hypothetical protein